jgi:hypothetical protein
MRKRNVVAPLHSSSECWHCVSSLSFTWAPSNISNPADIPLWPASNVFRYMFISIARYYKFKFKEMMAQWSPYTPGAKPFSQEKYH